MPFKKALIAAGLVIAKDRKAKHLSQADLAKRCLMDKAAISRIEAGKKNITLLTLFKIAAALEIEAAEIVSGGDIQNATK